MGIKLVFLLVIFVPVYLASVLPDLFSMRATRLLGLLMALVALVAVCYFGVPELLVQWIEAGRHTELLFTVSVAAAVAALLVRYWIMRQRFLHLQWPHEMSWFGFRRWSKLFLLRQGWEASDSERHPVLVSFVAKKGAFVVNVVCSVDAPSHDVVKRYYKIGEVVFICLSDVSDATVMQAAQLGIRISSYKALEHFDRILAAPLRTSPAGHEFEPLVIPVLAWDWLRSSCSPEAGERPVSRV